MWMNAIGLCQESMAGVEGVSNQCARVVEVRRLNPVRVRARQDDQLGIRGESL
jgi:hypothetical protein